MLISYIFSSYFWSPLHVTTFAVFSVERLERYISLSFSMVDQNVFFVAFIDGMRKTCNSTATELYPEKHRNSKIFFFNSHEKKEKKCMAST